MTIDFNDILRHDEKFRYQLLSRMQTDCDYYLGNGNRHSKHLWALNVTEQIDYMKRLWHSFPDKGKPEWLTLEQICDYEKAMSDNASLLDLLNTGAKFNDIHLVHDQIDNDPVTIVELHAGTLTDSGKEAWADVLNAKAGSVFEGIYGLHLVLSGVKAKRVDDFSRMLAGYCSAADYDIWVAPDLPTEN